MQVLTTLNIVIKDDELEDAIELIAELDRLEVDAVIVQDLGVAKLVRENFPSPKFCTSNSVSRAQCFGVVKAAKLGFKRVVLARETTTTEIKRIHKISEEHGIELEVFAMVVFVIATVVYVSFLERMTLEVATEANVLTRVEALQDFK